MNLRLLMIKLASTFVLAGQLLMGSDLSAAEAPALRGVYNALGGTMATVWVAQDLGLFTKHGNIVSNISPPQLLFRRLPPAVKISDWSAIKVSMLL